MEESKREREREQEQERVVFGGVGKVSQLENQERNWFPGTFLGFS